MIYEQLLSDKNKKAKTSKHYNAQANKNQNSKCGVQRSFIKAAQRQK